MSKAIIIVALLGLIAICGSSSTSIGKAYNRLNEFLVDKTESHDAYENIQVAKEHLAFLTSTPHPKTSADVDAYRQFVALETVDRKCDAESFEIIRKNVLASNTLPNIHKTKKGPMRRVENVIFQIARRHAEDCQDSYQAAYEAKKATMDKEQFDQVYTSFAKYFGVRVPGTKPYKLTTYPLDVYSLFGAFVVESQNIPDFEYLHEAIVINAEKNNDADKDCLVPAGANKKTIEDLFNKYVVQPCEYFTGELKEIFEPARQESLFAWGRREGKEALDYYQAWACYSTCQRVLKDRAFKSNALKSVIDHSFKN